MFSYCSEHRVNQSEITRIVHGYIVSCRGATQLEGSLLGIPPGYKANKL